MRDSSFLSRFVDSSSGILLAVNLHEKIWAGSIGRIRAYQLERPTPALWFDSENPLTAIVNSSSRQPGSVLVRCASAHTRRQHARVGISRSLDGLRSRR